MTFPLISQLVGEAAALCQRRVHSHVAVLPSGKALISDHDIHDAKAGGNIDPVLSDREPHRGHQRHMDRLCRYGFCSSLSCDRYDHMVHEECDQ